MQSEQSGVAARSSGRIGVRLAIAGAIVVFVGLVLTASLFISFGAGTFGPVTPSVNWYTIAGVGYILQAVGFFLVFMGIISLLRPSRQEG